MSVKWVVVGLGAIGVGVALIVMETVMLFTVFGALAIIAGIITMFFPNDITEQNRRDC